MALLQNRNLLLALSLLTLTTITAPALASEPELMHNNIVKDSAASASAGAEASASATGTGGGGGGPVPPPLPPPPGVPIPPGPGFGKGLNFHKSLNFNAGGSGAGGGFGPLLSGLIPGFTGFGGIPPPLPPPTGIPEVPPPVPIDGGLGGLPTGGPGYFGFPSPFLGPSYVPYSWVGSALGAKGDLLFPVLIFAFVLVGLWTVVNFLLGLIVPLLIKKFAVKEALVSSSSKSGSGRKFRSVGEELQEEIDDLTPSVTAAIHEEPTFHQHQHYEDPASAQSQKSPSPSTPW